MKPIAILYATREGQTRKVAEHLGDTLRGRGVGALVENVRTLPPGFELRGYSGAILAASVHAGRHEAEMVEFVRQHHLALKAMPTAFISVSLSESWAESREMGTLQREASQRDVRRAVEAFLSETAWQPDHIQPVAGALPYRQYGLIKRVLMRLIAARAGGSTDTAHDHEYTDWEALDRFGDQILAELQSRPGAEASATWA